MMLNLKNEEKLIKEYDDTMEKFEIENKLQINNRGIIDLEFGSDLTLGFDKSGINCSNLSNNNKLNLDEFTDKLINNDDDLELLNYTEIFNRRCEISKEIQEFILARKEEIKLLTIQSELVKKQMSIQRAIKHLERFSPKVSNTVARLVSDENKLDSDGTHIVRYEIENDLYIGEIVFKLEKSYRTNKMIYRTSKKIDFKIPCFKSDEFILNKITILDTSSNNNKAEMFGVNDFEKVIKNTIKKYFNTYEIKKSYLYASEMTAPYIDRKILKKIIESKSPIVFKCE